MSGDKNEAVTQKRTRKPISDAAFYKHSVKAYQEAGLDEEVTLGVYLEMLKDRAIEEAVNR